MQREDSVKDIGALLDWIKTQPALDASRIMVTGGSYGGYMTLAVMTHYSDRVRCAVELGGDQQFPHVSGAYRSLSARPAARGVRRRARSEDARFLRDHFALEQRGRKITKPMFIVAGRNDPRVPWTEGQQMTEALRKNNVPVWWLVAEDEGHGFAKKKNRDFLAAAHSRVRGAVPGGKLMASDNHNDRSRLMDILVSRSLSTSGNFTLHSGEKSTVYVDGKLTTMVAEAMPLVGRAFLQKIRERGWSPEAVGGLTLGADPIAFAIARESLEARPSIDAFVVRKEPKKHGTEKFVEGLEATEGKRVVILDDVCTKGDSTWQAIAKAQDAGMHVLGAICLVDRQQGATEMLAGKGIVLEHVFTLAELVAHKDGLSLGTGVQ